MRHSKGSHNQPRRLILIGLLAGALLPGCASGSSEGPAAGPQVGQATATSVRVDNRSTLELTVYLMRGPQANRLGTVSGSSTTVLAIPENLLTGGANVRFQIDPLGSTRRSTYDFLVTPGDQVQLIYPP